MSDSEKLVPANPREVHPCPECGAVGPNRLVIDTPIADDGLIYEARLTCIACQHLGPKVEFPDGVNRKEAEGLNGLPRLLASLWNNKYPSTS